MEDQAKRIADAFGPLVGESVSLALCRGEAAGIAPADVARAVELQLMAALALAGVKNAIDGMAATRRIVEGQQRHLEALRARRGR
jgi:hypothetical protein